MFLNDGFLSLCAIWPLYPCLRSTLSIAVSLPATSRRSDNKSKRRLCWKFFLQREMPQCTWNKDLSQGIRCCSTLEIRSRECNQTIVCSVSAFIHINLTLFKEEIETALLFVVQHKYQQEAETAFAQRSWLLFFFPFSCWYFRLLAFVYIFSISSLHIIPSLFHVSLFSGCILLLFCFNNAQI